MQTVRNTLLLSTLFGCINDKNYDCDDANVSCNNDETNSSDTSTSNETPADLYNIWSGPPITFTKESNADYNDPANQDAITDLVVLTRASRGSLFNVVLEDSADSASPAGVEWSKGTTDEIDSLVFDTLKGAAGNVMSTLPGSSYVMHLIEEDVYIDVRFISWTSGGSGGGFSYERSTQD